MAYRLGFGFFWLWLEVALAWPGSWQGQSPILTEIPAKSHGLAQDFPKPKPGQKAKAKARKTLASSGRPGRPQQDGISFLIQLALIDTSSFVLKTKVLRASRTPIAMYVINEKYSSPNMEAVRDGHNVNGSFGVMRGSLLELAC
ncbi:hypothetical protein B0H13DRAFT_1905228 [Mycena leptocephala]|nr:hypothetical protein B0H13DRAFT_1905228 [Mycena leptocephala]